MNLVNVSQNQNIDSADKLVLVSVSLFFPMVNLGDVISILWSLFKSSFSKTEGTLNTLYEQLLPFWNLWKIRKQ